MGTALPSTNGGLSVAAATFTTGGLASFGGTPEVIDCRSASKRQAAFLKPSTWAMMALGFAGIGLLAYRKRATLAAA